MATPKAATTTPTQWYTPAEATDATAKVDGATTTTTSYRATNYRTVEIDIDVNTAPEQHTSNRTTTPKDINNATTQYRHNVAHAKRNNHTDSGRRCDSLSGHAFLVGSETRKPIKMTIKIRSCRFCNKCQDDDNDPRFVEQYLEDNEEKHCVTPYPLRPWQEELHATLILEPHPTEIIFIVDTTGNQGKSWFARYYTDLHDNAQIIVPGKKADMALVVDPAMKVFFFDCPRSKQGEYIQYDFLDRQDHHRR